MSTRSTIAIELANGHVHQIYCHWDGYLGNNGQILLKHYQDAAKVQQLVSLGSLSTLQAEIGEQHEFDVSYDQDHDRYHWCKFYGRDRGEQDVAANEYLSFDDYRKNHQYEEYEYILRSTGEWQVSCHGNPYVGLAEAIAEEQHQQHLEQQEQ